MHRAIDRITAAATEEALNRLEEASRTDALTGVGNRRAFDETLSATLSAAARRGHEVTVVAVDLDGLKRINDTEGHAAGDAALMALVRALYAQLRDEDRVFRVGGDEFVILLPFTSVDAAELLMERIHRGGAPAFTWGAAGYPLSGGDARRLVEAADHDLYRRRQERRGDAATAPRRLTTLHPRQGLRRVGGWVWVPAAAVVIASLVATLVSSSAPRSAVEARGKPPQPATKPAHGGPGGAPAPTAPGGGEAAVAGTGTPAVTVGYTTPPGGATPGGPGSPGSPSNPGSPGGAPAPSGSGVLGVLEQVLSPVPLVGGNNGLLAAVGEILTGPTTTTAANLGSGSVLSLLG
jgi:diguanylate cyclase (GGDEF)-like protein